MKKCSLLLLVAFILFSSCASMGLLQEDLSLENLREDEGYVEMRIHKETAGKSLGLYAANEKKMEIPE